MTDSLIVNLLFIGIFVCLAVVFYVGRKAFQENDMLIRENQKLRKERIEFYEDMDYILKEVDEQ